MTKHDLQSLVKRSPDGYVQIPGIVMSRAAVFSATLKLGRRGTALNRLTKSRFFSFRDLYNRLGMYEEKLVRVKKPRYQVNNEAFKFNLLLKLS